MSLETTVGLAERPREMRQMCQNTVELLRLTWEGFRRQDLAPFDMADKLAHEVHHAEKALTAAITKGRPPADGDLLFVPMHLERIGDNLESLIGAIRTMIHEGVPFTERAMREINGLFERAIELVECVRDAVVTENRVLLRHIVGFGKQYAELADDYGLAHQQRLIEGVCLPKASSLYLAMLDYLKGVEWHACQIAEKLAVLRLPKSVA